MALSARSDIILVGASAGGLGVLKKITSSLPGDLQAAVIIVVHLPPDQHSDLAGILDRNSDLSIRQAADGEAVRYGTALVAPPDHHLVFEDSVIRVVSGPRVNAYRPSIDVTFKSAARRFGPRTIGVILTGGLKDGTDGLRAIKESGGRAVVQDPADAEFSSMPQNAIEGVEVDRVLKADGIAAALVEMAADIRELREARELAPPPKSDARPSDFVCPECKGTLLETKQDGWSTFRCRKGHAYTEQSLAIDKDASLQAALWSAARALHEQAHLFDRLASSSSSATTDTLKRRFKRKASVIREQGNRIEEAIARLERAAIGDELELLREPVEGSAD
ncbi:MAG TPA: chemotaxis protein CheB [Candidatus Eremiobacteraceae bacterium]|nr:chemotaxis protein CheB [Candidatus Eremiobacteraceae bacterium]